MSVYYLAQLARQNEGRTLAEQKTCHVNPIRLLTTANSASAGPRPSDLLEGPEAQEQISLPRGDGE